MNIWGVLMIGLCYWIFKGAVVWAYKNQAISVLFKMVIFVFLFTVALIGFGAVFKLW
jgi:hypothetical protein